MQQITCEACGQEIPAVCPDNKRQDCLKYPALSVTATDAYGAVFVNALRHWGQGTDFPKPLVGGITIDLFQRENRRPGRDVALHLCRSGAPISLSRYCNGYIHADPLSKP